MFMIFHLRPSDEEIFPLESGKILELVSTTIHKRML
jgi:hypothetical protein